MPGYESIMLLWMLFFSTALQGTTVVYNMRIAQITRRQIVTTHPSLIVASEFQQWYQLHNGLKQSSVGILTSYIRTGSSWYTKVDVAGAHLHNSFNCKDLRRNQTDDILISAGYGINPHPGTKITATGHVGIPTHRDTILDGIEFGTGHFALGPQLDGSQAYKLGRPHFLFWALRYIHFFPRTISAAQGQPWPPRYRFALGNIFDVYIAHQSNWKMQHRIEIGYDGTFGFGAGINPSLENFGTTLNFLRNNFYLSYAYRLKTFGTPSGIIITLSGGYDPYPACFGRRYGASIFVSWAINF